MKNRKVKSIRTHAGVQVGNQVLSGVNAAKHNVEMELHPAGVYIKAGHVETIVTYANIYEIVLLSEKES